jgi:hypothetical protein
MQDMNQIGLHVGFFNGVEASLGGANRNQGKESIGSF